MTNYNLSIDENGESFLTMIEDGEVLSITGDHPQFKNIVSAVLAGESAARFLKVTGNFGENDERVVVAHGQVWFEGEPVHSSLASTIVRYATEGRDTAGLIKFMERLASNPSRNSRDQLWDWVQAGGLQVDAEGYFLGFKGVDCVLDVHITNEDDDNAIVHSTVNYRSRTQGDATSDGVFYSNDYIPQNVGSVVTMPREDVQDDPSEGCSFGLHVGTFDYAHGFGSVTLEVKVDPADVVSVPKDSGGAKLRCCKYEVIAVHEHPTPEVYDFEPDMDPDYDEDGESYYDELVEREVPIRFLAKLRAVLGGGGRKGI